MMTTEQHGLITEDGRIIFYVHHLSEENRREVANVKAVYEENKALKTRIAELEDECDAWRGCVIINAKMEGPTFMGFDRSKGQRVFSAFWMPKPKVTTTETPSG